jgi:hypothetical protein
MPRSFIGRLNLAFDASCAPVTHAQVPLILPMPPAVGEVLANEAVQAAIIFLIGNGIVGRHCCINLGSLIRGGQSRSRPVVSVQAPPLSS